MDELSQISAAPTDTAGEPARRSVLEMSARELEEAVTEAGLPKFRARQLWRWVWRHGLTSFDEIIISLFVAGGDNSTITRSMFLALRDQIDPTIAAISTILIIVSSGLLISVQLLGNKDKSS